MKKSEELKKYKIKDPKLLNQVFTHKSYTGSESNNERLEFLGDAVLALVITDILMEKYPQSDEGDLTKQRSQLVSGQTLAKIAKELDFPQYLRTEVEAYKNNNRILAGALEAYIGAVYLESGLSVACEFIRSLFEKRLDQNISELNYKSILQEWCQKKYKETPLYKTEKEKGQDHKKIFFINVFIKGKIYGTGSSSQKKQAEQEAAKKAVKRLKISIS